MDPTQINDIRTQFKGISFSKYKKTEVRSEFIQNMKKGKIEPACYWCAELICAGHFADVWEIILHYMGKHIHLGNPKLVIYLEMRYGVFREIMSSGLFSNEVNARNHTNIRKLFAEIVAIMTLSNRKHSFEPIKINRIEEFDMTQMPDRLKATALTFCEPIFLPKDPKELYIAINEFAYHISCATPDIMRACYWIEWTIEFDLICKKRKEVCKCERRSKIAVETKYQCDLIWLVWDTLHHYCEKKANPFITKIMGALYNLFCIKYTTGACKKRRYMLYFAVGLLVDAVPTNIELIGGEKTAIQVAVEKIGEIYKQIKKNEESPNTDYLFAHLEKQNTLEQSIRKMELLGTMDVVSNRPYAP
jgi:hypothetical protein